MKSTRKFILYLAIISFIANIVLPCAAQVNTPYGLFGPQQLAGPLKIYSTPVLKGVKLDPKNPFNMQFIIDTGNAGKVDKDAVNRLINYFLAALTIPEEQLWVNLSPYEADRIICNELAVTEFGKDMLVQDYLLKQLAASLTYPEQEPGKSYWNAIHGIDAIYCGRGNNNFSKVWIVPDRAKLYENGVTALIAYSRLKVMQEEDYSAIQANQGYSVGTAQEGTVSRVAFRKYILPQIVRDVNEGERFTSLRQMYNAFILAAWFKKNVEQSIFQYYIDQKKVNGIDLQDKSAKQKIYALYVEAFKKGVYNYIKQEHAEGQRAVPGSMGITKITSRQYFSGGVVVGSQGLDVVHLAPGQNPAKEPDVVQAGPVAFADVIFGSSSAGDVSSSTRVPLKREELSRPFVQEIIKTVVDEQLTELNAQIRMRMMVLLNNVLFWSGDVLVRTYNNLPQDAAVMLVFYFTMDDIGCQVTHAFREFYNSDLKAGVATISQEDAAHKIACLAGAIMIKVDQRSTTMPQPANAYKFAGVDNDTQLTRDTRDAWYVDFIDANLRPAAQMDQWKGYLPNERFRDFFGALAYDKLLFYPTPIIHNLVISAVRSTSKAVLPAGYAWDYWIKHSGDDSEDIPVIVVDETLTPAERAVAICHGCHELAILHGITKPHINKNLDYHIFEWVVDKFAEKRAKQIIMEKYGHKDDRQFQNSLTYMNKLNRLRKTSIWVEYQDEIKRQQKKFGHRYASIVTALKFGNPNKSGFGSLTALSQRDVREHRAKLREEIRGEDRVEYLEFAHAIIDGGGLDRILKNNYDPSVTSNSRKMYDWYVKYEQNFHDAVFAGTDSAALDKPDGLGGVKIDSRNIDFGQRNGVKMVLSPADIVQLKASQGMFFVVEAVQNDVDFKSFFNTP